MTTSTSLALPEFATIGDAMAWAQDRGVLDAAQVLGDGYDPLKNKSRLVNVPFLIVDWTFNHGDQGEYVSCKIITQANEKFRISDGGTGIYRQLWDLADSGVPVGTPIAVYGGVVQSDYKLRDQNGKLLLDEKGKEQSATTFYLSTERK